MERLRTPQFGDVIENGWASENNPTRIGYFVREGRRTGRMNPGRYFEVTDGAGKFWELPVDRDHKISVRPGHLTGAETKDGLQCIACDKHFAEGDAYYSDVSGGFLHADCCGPERESYVGADGEPMKPGEPIPEPSIWVADD